MSTTFKIEKPALIAGRRTSKKALLITSAATLALMMSAVPMTAQAQVTVDVNACGDLPVKNAASGSGATINVDTSATCEVASGDIIELEDNSQDNTTINIATGTILDAQDTDDEDVVIFLDNAEDLLTVNIADGATLRGANGVIFLEGDGTTITNNGLIGNYGNASEGAVYYDRDTDSAPNTLTNIGTITNSGGGPTIGIDALLDTTTITLSNSGVISNTDVSDSDSDAINFNGDPGTTGGVARGCLENGGADVLCQFNLTLLNSGTISTARDNGSNAAIRIEQDAVVSGTITNMDDGEIIGARNGINVNGAHADHDLTINNSGRIEGTSGDGVVITGAGVTLINQASGTIIGGDAGVQVANTTITVDIGPSNLNNFAVRDQ